MAKRFALMVKAGVGLLVVLLFAPGDAFSLVPEKVKPVVEDRQDFQTPDHVHLHRWVGTRIEANEGNRLVKLDPSRLLEGYRKRPGRQRKIRERSGESRRIEKAFRNVRFRLSRETRPAHS